MKIAAFLLLNFSILLSAQPLQEAGNCIEDKAAQAEAFCQQEGYNTDFCILIDMSLHSGFDRLFVYDLKADSILDQGLCAHGCGQAEWGEDETKTNPVFSNTPESHCSSLGKYRIGDRGYSSWGIHVNYKLHGLEESNSNAFERYIVLHSWEAVPEQELFPLGTPEGWGCPAISNALMHRIDERLQATELPVLMWIYE